MGNLKHYQLAAAGLAILGAALIADHNALRADAADIMRYAGTTAPQIFDGSQGLFAPHRACATKIPNAVWCTTEMTRNGGPHTFASDPPLDGAWIQLAPQGGVLAHDGQPAGTFGFLVDALGFNTIADETNCNQWRGGGLGKVIKQEPTILGPRVVVFNADCSAESFRPAACCSTNPAPIQFGPLNPPGGEGGR